MVVLIYLERWFKVYQSSQRAFFIYVCQSCELQQIFQYGFNVCVCVCQSNKLLFWHSLALKCQMLEFEFRKMHPW